MIIAQKFPQKTQPTQKISPRALPSQNTSLTLHSPFHARMAESVDATVSNTVGATHPGSIPGPGTESRNFSDFLLFINTMIPKIKEIELPLLRLLAASSPMTWNDCTALLSEHFKLTPLDLSKMMPNRNCGEMKYKVGWAKANLKRSGFVDAVSHGVYTITEKGSLYLANLDCGRKKFPINQNRF